MDILAILFSFIAIVISLCLYISTLKKYRVATLWNYYVDSLIINNKDKVILFSLNNHNRCNEDILVFYYNTKSKTLKPIVLLLVYERSNNKFTKIRNSKQSLCSSVYNVLLPPSGYSLYSNFFGYIYRNKYNIERKIKGYKQLKSSLLRHIYICLKYLNNVKYRKRLIKDIYFVYSFLKLLFKNKFLHTKLEFSYSLNIGNDADNISKLITGISFGYIRIQPNEYCKILDVKIVDDKYIENNYKVPHTSSIRDNDKPQKNSKV